MEEILTYTTQAETTIQTTTETMTELQMLEQINNNLVIIGEVQNLILGILVLFGLWGMYKAICKLVSIFI